MQKRIMLTLEEGPYRDMQKLAKAMGMPRSIISAVCNESIKQTLELWKNVQKRGKFTISDLFTQLAQMTMEEVMPDEKPAQKAKTVAKRTTKKL